jgi:hypothetical protein
MFCEFISRSTSLLVSDRIQVPVCGTHVSLNRLVTPAQRRIRGVLKWIHLAHDGLLWTRSVSSSHTWTEALRAGPIPSWVWLKFKSYCDKASPRLVPSGRDTRQIKPVQNVNSALRTKAYLQWNLANVRVSTPLNVHILIPRNSVCT